MTIEEKIKDIISAMLKEGMLDYERALNDNDYLLERISLYLDARKMTIETLNMVK